MGRRRAQTVFYIATSVLLALLMLGYAAGSWSDQLKSTLTVNYGVFDIYVSGGQVSYASPEVTVQLRLQPGTPTPGDVDNPTYEKIGFIASNLYPGARVEVKYSVVNGGTLTAAVKHVKFTELAVTTHSRYVPRFTIYASLASDTLYQLTIADPIDITKVIEAATQVASNQYVYISDGCNFTIYTGGGSTYTIYLQLPNLQPGTVIEITDTNGDSLPECIISKTASTPTITPGGEKQLVLGFVLSGKVENSEGENVQVDVIDEIVFGVPYVK